MQRNEDLYIIRKNPLIEAINIVLSQKPQSIKGIIYSSLGLFVSYLFNWFQKKRIQRIQKKIDHLEIQDPLNKTLLLQLNEQWKEGDFEYNNFIHLLPQYKQLGKIGVFKNIYFYLNMDQNIELGQLRFYVNSSNLDYLLRANIPRTKLFQFIKPKIPCFLTDNMFVDFARKNQNIQSMFLKNFDEYAICNGLLREIKKYPHQGKLVFQYLAQKAFKNDNLFQGTIIQWDSSESITVNQNQNLCIKCTAVIKDDQIRLTNVKAIANDFVRMKIFQKASYQSKIKVFQTGVLISKILMSIFGLLTFYQIAQYILNQIEPLMLKQEYPGLNQVKNHLTEVYCHERLKCLFCNKKKANFIFIPCYHLQSCKTCFDKENQLECKSCKTTIYCGIPIFVPS